MPSALFILPSDFPPFFPLQIHTRVSVREQIDFERAIKLGGPGERLGGELRTLISSSSVVVGLFSGALLILRGFSITAACNH